MLDEILELFERDRKTSRRTGGLRGRLFSLLQGEEDSPRYQQNRSRHGRHESVYRDDDTDDETSEDVYDNRRTSGRKGDRDIFDFGD